MCRIRVRVFSVISRLWARSAGSGIRSHTDARELTTFTLDCCPNTDKKITGNSSRRSTNGWRTTVPTCKPGFAMSDGHRFTPFVFSVNVSLLHKERRYNLFLQHCRRTAGSGRRFDNTTNECCGLLNLAFAVRKLHVHCFQQSLRRSCAGRVLNGAQ